MAQANGLLSKLPPGVAKSYSTENSEEPENCHKPTASTGCPFSLGRIALLGIAHRTIHISRVPFRDNRNVRKAIPTTAKTLGDRILLSRYERRLKQCELAEKMEVSEWLVSKWERDICQPTGDQLRLLESLLAPPL